MVGGSRSRLVQPPGQIAEATPLEALALREMPTCLHFRRDHFAVPHWEPGAWRLDVDGRRLTLADLHRLPKRTQPVVLQCAGDRRSEYAPPTRGVPWSLGAVSEATWSGAALRDVLALVGTRRAAYVVLEGADGGRVEGAAAPIRFARALPADKALHPDTLLAWEMNGEPLPVEHGAPLRAVVPGWYATDSVKWLERISLLDEPFDGHFEVSDYRLQTEEGQHGVRLTRLPVTSLVTSVTDGDILRAGSTILQGVAWGGDHGIARVELDVDGAGWRSAELEAPASPYSRTFWQLPWSAEPGVHTLHVRATDGAGAQQPDTPVWNVRGFANASVHRVTVAVRG
jgi:DMSO/TMAO reductase YedYZ molybdopterin-dependent catalytic subunit